MAETKGKPLSTSFDSLIQEEIAKRMGITTAETGDKPGEVVDKPGTEYKDTLGAFSQTTISAAHEILNRFLEPETELEMISRKQLMQEIEKLEKDWRKNLEVIKKYSDIPAVEAYINDVNTAFEKVRKASVFNRKPLLEAHNIFHDLESIWTKTDPPRYGVTETGKVLAK